MIRGTRLTASFGLTEDDPGFNPNADLDGDGEVTLLDFGILVNNFGAIGADALTGAEQAMTEGLTVLVRVQLVNWGGHATRVLRLESRAKRVGTESNPAAPVYVKVVETTAPTDEVEVELTLPAGAYTVQAKANHWLRGEVAVVSSVPWIFAAPTGANKVTVYWDEVPGATGYRVRWGTQSGVYPNSSAVLPATARQWSITGLVTEQTYYVVVQAEYNGLWGPPSEEDSAVPHVGAIPWDSGDARNIISRVRQVTNSAADEGMLDVIGPDERIYSDDGVRQPDTYFDMMSFSVITPQFGFETPLTRTGGDTLENTFTGPYRRVTSSGGFIGARGIFWVPSTFTPRYPYTQIRITPRARDTGAEDTPCIYFGYSVRQERDGQDLDVEAGIMYHPSGRERVNYPRWQAYFVKREGKSRRRVALKDTFKQRAHILDSLAGGNEVLIELQLFPRDKLARLRIRVADPLTGDFFIREITGTAQVASRPNGRFRRVHSIAQREQAIENLGLRRQGYIRTGSFVQGMGVGFNVAEGGWLEPPAQLQEGILYMWNDWTAGSTSLQGSFPASGIVNWVELNPYSRELVNITLPVGD